MKPIKKNYEIHASIACVWNALVNCSEIENWDAGPAKMDDKVGSRFELRGGDIWGTNTRMEVNKLLIQDWYAGKLTETNGKTKVTLLRENVPNSEFGGIDDG